MTTLWVGKIINTVAFSRREILCWPFSHGDGYGFVKTGDGAGWGDDADMYGDGYGCGESGTVHGDGDGCGGALLSGGGSSDGRSEEVGYPEENLPMAPAICRVQVSEGDLRVVDLLALGVAT